MPPPLARRHHLPQAPKKFCRDGGSELDATSMMLSAALPTRSQ
jgi:hypothetical protein